MAECVETFLANARFVGLIRSIAGTEHLLAVEDALDKLRHAPEADQRGARIEGEPSDPEAIVIPPKPRTGGRESSPGDLDNICFVISPIGSDDSEERKHADLMMGALIEPAVESLGLTAVRADKISKPGLITGQVLDHLTRAKIVVADLSFGNPNVYYELALRQALRRPQNS